MTDNDTIRSDLLAALMRIRLGSALRSSGRLSVKAVADEAKCGRHHLTQTNRDIERFIKLVASDYRVANGKEVDPTLAQLREKLEIERARSSALAAQNAVLLAAIDVVDGPRGFGLRSV